MGVRTQGDDGDDLVVPGNLSVHGTIGPPRARSSILAQEDLAKYPIKMTDWRVFDAMQTNIPGTPASDDLGLIGTTHGTDCPYLSTGDLKAAGATTRRARCTVAMPVEYQAGETVNIVVSAGMKTTIADVSATVDIEVYKSARDGLKTGSDLCATAATTINSTTFSDKTFSITSSGLSPGDELDIRLSVAVNDAATATAVIGAVGAVDLKCDIKG